jgi:hypothetical protein
MATEKSILIPIIKQGVIAVNRNQGINIDNISFANVVNGVTQLWVESSYQRDNIIFTTELTPAAILALANSSGYIQNGLTLYSVTSVDRGSVTPYDPAVTYLLNNNKINNITLLPSAAGSRFEYQVEFGKSPWIFEIEEIIPVTNGGDLTVDQLTVNTIIGPNAVAGVIEQHGITTGITAFAGGGQTDAVILVSEYSSVDTVATAADSVKLPDLTGTVPLTGRRFVIRNTSANSLAVFPPVSGNLGAGVNTVVALTAGSRIEYVSTGALTYISFLG